MHDGPLISMQWGILLLAAAGKFFEGMIVFITGVALPLITVEFGLGPREKGAIAVDLAIAAMSTHFSGLVHAVETNGVSFNKVGCGEAEVSGPAVPTAR